MALAVTLLLASAAVWSVGHSFPIPGDDGVLPSSEKQNISTNDTKTIFEIIESANRNANRVLTQVDIALPISRNALTCNGCLWEKSANGMVIVPYVISQYSESKAAIITAALQEFTSMTCIVFVQRITQKDYLSLENSSSCWSYIGKIGGKQTVGLSESKCIYHGVIQHEIMHSLSFFHEHSRIDRDQYVDIQWDNIIDNNKANFETDKGETLNVSYDYVSVMHYNRNAFSVNGKATIVPKPNPSVQIGQRQGLSSLDIEKINKLYNCNLCRKKFLAPTGNFSSNSMSTGPESDSCMWLIQVPSQKVFLNIDTFISPSNDCDSYIKVYDGITTSNTLLMTLCPNKPIPPLISSGAFMLVEFVRSQSTPSSFNAIYKSVVYGNTFNTPDGNIIFPESTSLYPNNANVTWDIIAPKGQRVSLDSIFFDLQPSNFCSADYLIIKDGASNNSPVLHKFCGSGPVVNIVSTGNVLLLQFISDSTVRKNGFNLAYSFVQ